MLPFDKRQNNKIIFKMPHVLQRIKERKQLFPNGSRADECYNEIKYAIRNPNKGIFVEDKREDSQSNFICVFLGDSGEIIAIPCVVNDTCIVVTTVKDVRNDTSNPNWYVRNYNEVAKTRNLQSLPYMIKRLPN